MNYDLTLSPKEGRCTYNGIDIRFFNQSSLEWTHPYEYENNGSNLHNAGCGIFSMAVVIKKMCGEEVDVNKLADFSVDCGGRGDDGTDRPELLAGMVRAGLDLKYSFIYMGDGLVNDPDSLWRVLSDGGCAMCNLRVGHIVAVIGCREINGERQMLIVDSACESADRRVRDNVREVISGSEVTSVIRNSAGLETGLIISHAVYWAALSAASDANFIWPRR